MNAYEVHNPSFNDMNLEQQIEHGINDWAVEGKSGHIYFGCTAQEAIAIAASFNNQ
jgi:TPP-dependent pyruvate/acetoin dehydrogenase alpha subunit